MPSIEVSPPGATASTWRRSTPIWFAWIGIPAKKSGTSPITVTGDDGKEIGDIYKMAYSATVAPLAIKGKIIIGISGAEYGIRGFIDAYDAKTGKRLWRFLHGPGRRRQIRARPESPRNLGRQFLADRRRLGMGHRNLRPRAQQPLLGHRQSLARL